MARPPIQTNSICKHYGSGQGFVPAISNLSLIIEKNDFVAIRGRSGSGKTTLLNILGLLERPNSGQYFLNGEEVATLSERTRAQIRNREVGFVFQLPTLLPRSSTLENVALPLIYSGIHGAERWRRANDALDRVGLIHRRNHWPNQLSGGEQQRVAIARAIVNKPAVLLADEPTGALDSNTSDEILALFADLNRDGCTIVMVTHDREVAERARRRISFHDGCMVDGDICPKQAPALKLIATEGRK